MSVFGIGSELIPSKKLDQMHSEAAFEIFEVLKKAEKKSTQLGADYITVLHPTNLTLNLQEDIYTDQLESYLKEKSQPLVRIHQCMEDALLHLEYTEYAWPINGHFNEYGYKVMTECIYNEMLKKYPDLLE